jgi:hypothetical protein
MAMPGMSTCVGQSVRHCSQAMHRSMLALNSASEQQVNVKRPLITPRSRLALARALYFSSLPTRMSGQ